MSVSVVIRTFNAGDRFDEVLSSLRDLADEIIAIDSGSADRTIEIAEKHGAIVVFQKWLGYIGQANEGIKRATKDWVFLLDQDEIVSAELREEIKRELNNPRFDGYEINRQTTYFGKPMKYTWQPDYVFRLGRRDKNARCGGEEPHEIMGVDGSAGKLRKSAILIHHSYKNFGDQLQKNLNYAEIGAQSYFERGKKFKILNLIFNPAIAFARQYFFKLGFLDGARGFIAAAASAAHTFAKYVFLFELERENENRDD